MFASIKSYIDNFFAYRQEIIIDTDIGDDIDDAFAIAWALTSKRVKTHAILTAHGNTMLRARLVSRILDSLNQNNIKVFIGRKTISDVVFTQAVWAEQGPPMPNFDGIRAALDLIRKRPGKITLVALAPLHNIEAMILTDADTFRNLKHVVLMGGSIKRGYNTLTGEPNFTPQVEHNIRLNPEAFRHLLESGVPITLMPLDSVQARPTEEWLQGVVTTHPDLGQLLRLWQDNNPFNVKQATLYDLIAMAAVTAPKFCHLETIKIVVDPIGLTFESADGTEIQVCLEADHEALLLDAARDLNR